MPDTGDGDIWVGDEIVDDHDEITFPHHAEKSRAERALTANGGCVARIRDAETELRDELSADEVDNLLRLLGPRSEPRSSEIEGTSRIRATYWSVGR